MSKIINFEKLCLDNDIELASPSDKHFRQEWVHIHCPFCNDMEKFHLGYSLQDGYFHCWKCGWHPVKETISTLLGISEYDASEVLRKYYTRRTESKFTKPKKEKLSISSVELPPGTISKPMSIHRKYLEQRKYNINKLKESWKIKFTGPVGEYKFRIVIPIFYHGELVSYQTRDVTGKARLRYKSCPKDKEKKHYKDILYGIDYCKDRIVVVEGVFDVWKIGRGAVATFGVNYTRSQLKLLSRFSEVMILFDGDEAGRRNQSLLQRELELLGIGVVSAKLPEGFDPGTMTTKMSEKVKLWLIGEKYHFRAK